MLNVQLMGVKYTQNLRSKSFTCQVDCRLKLHKFFSNSVLVSNAVDEAYAQAQLLLVTAVCCFVTQHHEVFGFGDIFHYPVDDNVATQPYV